MKGSKLCCQSTWAASLIAFFFRFLTLIYNNVYYYLTLTLLEPKMINLCHQYRARPICAVWPGSILLANQLPSSYLDFPKMIVDSSKNARQIITFKKFSRLRVNKEFMSFYHYNINHVKKKFTTIFCHENNGPL